MAISLPKACFWDINSPLQVQKKVCQSGNAQRNTDVKDIVRVSQRRSKITRVENETADLLLEALGERSTQVGRHGESINLTWF